VSSSGGEIAGYRQTETSIGFRIRFDEVAQKIDVGVGRRMQNAGIAAPEYCGTHPLLQCIDNSRGTERV
jgi:hypothetical protein